MEKHTAYLIVTVTTGAGLARIVMYKESRGQPDAGSRLALSVLPAKYHNSGNAVLRRQNPCLRGQNETNIVLMGYNKHWDVKDGSWTHTTTIKKNSHSLTAWLPPQRTRKALQERHLSSILTVRTQNTQSMHPSKHDAKPSRLPTSLHQYTGGIPLLPQGSAVISWSLTLKVLKMDQ